MRSIEIQTSVPLSSVKPLEGLSRYRLKCLENTRRVLSGASYRRTRSPVTGQTLEPFGKVEDFEYLRCPETGSFFLADLTKWQEWKALLETVAQLRQESEIFAPELAESRNQSVYLPKLEWILDTIRLQGIERPRVLEAATAPSAVAPFLHGRKEFAQVVSVSEMELAHRGQGKPEGSEPKAQVALALESVDRVDDPVGLLRGLQQHLAQGGLLFVTALVASGFDVTVLGLRNLYLYPPDRTNCFSLGALRRLLEKEGFHLLEVSTPGLLDLEIVQAHRRLDPFLPLGPFETQLISADDQTRFDFQSFLQKSGLSSFARIVARKV